MAFTGSDVITSRARPILDDETVDGTTERWSNAILLIWLNEGARIIAEKRPESLLTAFYTLATYADIGAISSTVPLPDKYRDALVDYVCYRALGQDGQDERDLKRSQSFYESFARKAGLTAVLLGR